MHRKGHTTRRRKMKGGYYGAAGPIPGTTGAMQWNKGLEVAPPAHVKTGGRRRKSSKKSSKRSRKIKGGMAFCPPDMSAPGPNGMCADGSEPLTDGPTGGRKRSTRRRKMKGGGSFGAVSASFQGQGVNGMAHHVPVSVRTPVGSAAGGSFNNFMAKPGSSFGI